MNRWQYSHKHYILNKDAINARNREWYKNNRDSVIEKNKRNVDKKRNFLKNYLSSHPCVDCGESDYRCLDFDHVNGNKFACVSSMAWRGFKIQTIEKEIDKCVTRCANCHRRRHYDK